MWLNLAFKNLSEPIGIRRVGNSFKRKFSGRRKKDICWGGPTDVGKGLLAEAIGKSVKQRATGTNYGFKRPAFVSDGCLFLCFCAGRIVARARRRERRLGTRDKAPGYRGFVEPPTALLRALLRLYVTHIRDFLPWPALPSAVFVRICV